MSRVDLGKQGLDATTQRARRAMLANLRHELRTPINAITNYSEMLLEDATDAGFVADVEKIHGAGGQLLALVNEILDPARVDAGQLDGDWEGVGARLRHELLTPVNAIIGYSELLLEDAADGGNDDVTADLRRIREAAGRFLALISDVVSFARGEGGDAAARDDGAAAMAQEVMAAIRPLDEQPSRRAITAGGPVLVVDDNELNRDVLSRRLERDGHRVKTAAGGREALAMLRAEAFDLVLLDVMMPDVNGYQALRELKADAALRDIPVIMISALDELAGVVRCLEIGAEDYLPKPFNPVILRARVGACLEKKRLRNQEVEYLHNVARVTAAAAAVESEAFDPEMLAEVARRDDALGQLARVFQKMAREVYAREQRLKQQVQQLRIEIDETKKAKQVAEITETDYFQRLQERARGLRRRNDP